MYCPAWSRFVSSPDPNSPRTSRRPCLRRTTSKNVARLGNDYDPVCEDPEESRMRRKVTIAVVQLFVLVQTVIAAGVASAQDMKVACVGDSITAGGSWCAYAESSLGSGYTAESFGVSGTTLLEGVGQRSFRSSNRYEPSRDFAPNIVVIMLGTNDSMPRNWNAGKDHFVKDYEALIDSYTSLASKPTVFLSTAPPASDDNQFSISGMTIEKEINPLIKQVAMTKMCPVVDVWAAFGGDVEKLDSFDGVHPGDAGQKVIGEAVAKAIKAPMIPAGSAGMGGSAGGGSAPTAGAGGVGQAGASTSATAGASGIGQAGATSTAAGAGGANAAAMSGTGAAGSGMTTVTSGAAGSSTSSRGNPGAAGVGGAPSAAGNTGTTVNPVSVAGTGAPETPPSDGGGGCRMAGNATGPSGPVATLLLLLGLVIRRKRGQVR
jgi:lysophospholipase L1-like esterase